MSFSDVENFINKNFNTPPLNQGVEPYLKILYDCVVESPDGAVVEIGSEYGFSSVALAQGCREKNKQFISIDPYIQYINTYSYNPKRVRESEIFYTEKVLFHFCESIQYKQDILDCIDKIPDILSCVFIDGFHDSTNTEREWDLLFPRIVPNGWMIMDDANWTINQSGIGFGGPNLTVKKYFNSDIFNSIINEESRPFGFIAGKKR